MTSLTSGVFFFVCTLLQRELLDSSLVSGLFSAGLALEIARAETEVTCACSRIASKMAAAPITFALEVETIFITPLDFLFLSS